MQQVVFLKHQVVFGKTSSLFLKKSGSFDTNLQSILSHSGKKNTPEALQCIRRWNFKI